MSATAYAERPTASSTPALFGRVMGLVAVTVGFATFGVWLGRNAGGPTWFIAWLVALGCLFGLQFANSRGNTGLALVLLFAFGLLIGVSVSMTVNYYSAVDPTAVRQAFGATALFVGVLGVRRVRDPPRPVVSLPVRVLWTAGVARRRDRADLRSHLSRLHGLVARRPGRLRPLHGRRLQPPPSCRLRPSDPARRRHLSRCPEHLPVLPADFRAIKLTSGRRDRSIRSWRRANDGCWWRPARDGASRGARGPRPRAARRHARVSSPSVRPAFELVVDKLPGTPSRWSAARYAPRVFFSARGGRVLGGDPVPRSPWLPQWGRRSPGHGYE